MAIVDSKERAGWPGLMLSMLRLNNVEYDRYPVFIVVAHKSLVSIGSVCTHNPIALIAALCWLVVRDNNPRPWGQWQLGSIRLILVHHIVGIYHC